MENKVKFVARDCFLKKQCSLEWNGMAGHFIYKNM